MRNAISSVMELADKGFRSAAKYAFAFNQSRAKVLMDPMYVAVSNLLLRGDIPLHPRLQNETFPDSLYLEYRGKSRKLQYFIEDWNFDEAKPELLTPRQRQMMHTVALGETSGSAVADSFLRAFRTDPELAAFFGVWFTEELNHFMGYHLYLEKMGERWPAQRGLDVARVDFIPYSEDALEVAACNMYQELLAYLIYRSFAKQVKDPFLGEMLSRFAKDELRHYKFYQQVVARHIQRHPEFRTVVLKNVIKATSPYNQVSGSASNVLDHLEMGAFYFRKPEYEFFLREMEYLFGTSLRGFFDWFFKGVIEKCTFCHAHPYQCSCEHFEDGKPPERRNPEWWKQVSRAGEKDLAPNVDEWTRALLSQARARSSVQVA